jgi:hypothetical protein
MAELPRPESPAPQPPRHEEEKIEASETKASMLSNLIAIIGVIILVVVIVWGLVHLAGLSKSFFSSLFPASAPTITVTAPANVTSGDQFTVSWKYSPKESGTYAILYQCNDDLRFETPSASGSMQSIPCGATFLLNSSEANALMLTPTLSNTSSVSVPFTVLYLPSATSSMQAQGGTSITVTPAANTQKPVTTPTVSVSKPHPAGPADLSVRIVSLTMAGSTGIAVFDISNVGSGYSGAYTFTATLPTSSYSPSYYGAPQQEQSYIYNSSAQKTLGPGDHIVSTLTFTQAVPGGIFSVTVDPSNSVNDENRINNYAYQTLGGYNQPQPYYTY